jgi:hypothetical protein
MKVDLGNNYVHEVEIFLNGYVAVIYQEVGISERSFVTTN